MDNKSYSAVVQCVFPNGKHGPNAVASIEVLGNVTFALKPPVWEEKYWPEEGDIVVLSEIRKKTRGWRAYSGRFFQPSDEQPTTKQSSTE